MQKIVKQVAGIDVAQDELVVCLGRMNSDWTPETVAHKTFANTAGGFKALVSWSRRLLKNDELPIRYVMEATGVYHEQLAYFLDKEGYQVSIVLPNRISNYHRTLQVRTVTDKSSSETIARFGLERKLEDWVKPRTVYRQMRQLTRERDQVVAERTMAKNQLHAEESEAAPHEKSLVRIKARIGFLQQQDQEIREDLTELIRSDPEVFALIKRLSSIPGVGNLTAAIVLAETNGFDMIRNRRQLAAYAGLDVMEKQSGTSIKGKPRISKRGNRHLRKAMHLPALVAIRGDERFKAVFARLVARHGIKMKAAVAIQRKLLEMMYTVFKNGTTYDKSYLKPAQGQYDQLDSGEEQKDQESDQ